MKPYVICHMCTSIDGRILANRWANLAATIRSGKLFETTAASFGIGAWLVGTTTMKEFADRHFKLKAAKEPVERVDHLANPGAKSFAIGADAKGVLRYKRNDVDGDHVVLLLSELVSDDYLAHLRAAGVSYLFCGRDHVDVRQGAPQDRNGTGYPQAPARGRRYLQRRLASKLDSSMRSARSSFQ